MIADQMEQVETRLESLWEYSPDSEHAIAATNLKPEAKLAAAQLAVKVVLILLALILATGCGPPFYIDPSAMESFLVQEAEAASQITGSLVGWGYNFYGQTDVPAGNDFMAIAAGGYYSLALR